MNIKIGQRMAAALFGVLLLWAGAAGPGVGQVSGSRPGPGPVGLPPVVTIQGLLVNGTLRPCGSVVNAGDKLCLVYSASADGTATITLELNGTITLLAIKSVTGGQVYNDTCVTVGSQAGTRTLKVSVTNAFGTGSATCSYTAPPIHFVFTLPLQGIVVVPGCDTVKLLGALHLTLDIFKLTPEKAEAGSESIVRVHLVGDVLGIGASGRTYEVLVEPLQTDLPWHPPDPIAPIPFTLRLVPTGPGAVPPDPCRNATLQAMLVLQWDASGQVVPAVILPGGAGPPIGGGTGPP